MRKSFLLLLTIGILGCSDGDLTIDTLDFNDTAMLDCDNVSANGANVFFKIRSDEALILQLPSGTLNQANSSTDSLTTVSNIPSQSKLIYRLFSENVTNAYFCSDLPPATPVVIEEIAAESGQVTIKSIAVNDSTEIASTIELEGVTFIDAAGNRITNLTVNEFGVVTVPIN